MERDMLQSRFSSHQSKTSEMGMIPILSFFFQTIPIMNWYDLQIFDPNSKNIDGDMMIEKTLELAWKKLFIQDVCSIFLRFNLITSKIHTTFKRKLRNPGEPPHESCLKFEMPFSTSRPGILSIKSQSLHRECRFHHLHVAEFPEKSETTQPKKKMKMFQPKFTNSRSIRYQSAFEGFARYKFTLLKQCAVFVLKSATRSDFFLKKNHQHHLSWAEF